jgi:hypothetical protein
MEADNENEEFNKYVKKLEARAWAGISIGVLLVLGWVFYELLTL